MSVTRKAMTASLAIAVVVALVPTAYGADEATTGKSAGAGTESGGPTKLDRDLEKYWGKQRKPTAVRGQLFRKQSRFDAELFGGIIPTDAFRDYVVAGLRALYFPIESVGIGFRYGEPMASEADLEQRLQERLPNQKSDIGDELQHMALLELQFAPIYGKINLLGHKLTHFELVFDLGAGWVGTTYVPAELRAVEEREESHNALLLGGGFGFRLFAMDWLSLTIDLTQFMFARNPNFDDRDDSWGKLEFPTMISFGIGALLPTAKPW